MIRARTPAEHARLGCKRTLGPRCLEVAERRRHASVLAAHEVRELEPNAVALVPRAAVLVRVGRVSPAVLVEERGDPRQVVEPDGDVGVDVRSRDGPAWKSTAQPPKSQ